MGPVEVKGGCVNGPCEEGGCVEGEEKVISDGGTGSDVESEMGDEASDGLVTAFADDGGGGVGGRRIRG